MQDTFIFLYGPPGSGKSACGQALARNLELPFYDLDQEIETRAGMGIPEIFRRAGEPAFREQERASLEAILARPTGVVSLGGGALLDPGNRARVEAAGPVICLAAPLATLLERLGASESRRPLLAEESSQAGTGRTAPVSASRLAGLLEERAAHYDSFQIRLDSASQGVLEVAWEAQIRLGTFHVHGMGAGYDVHVRAGGLEALGPALQARRLGGPVAVASDERVGALYGEQAIRSLQSAGFVSQPVFIPAGEQHKTIETVRALWVGFLASGLERTSSVVALGGGVVGDLAGFAAATYLRGVAWIAAPTTLLAMVDASLGGKTGADLPQGKNLVGAFYPPRLVLADPRLLQTLPQDELRSGLAEVVKAGIIADGRLFARCAQGWPPVDAGWDELIRRAMAVKIQVIEADPFEQGQRAALNLGHTIGHAVEQASGYRLRHGEAVAIGLVVEARLAERIGLAEPGLAETIREALAGLGLPVEVPARISRPGILDALQVDKKRLGGKVRFALPVRIGQVQTGVEIPDKIVSEEL